MRIPLRSCSVTLRSGSYSTPSVATQAPNTPGTPVLGSTGPYSGFGADFDLLTERRDEAEGALSRVRIVSGLDGLPTSIAGLHGAREEHDASWRRAMIRVVIERVTVHPTEVRGRFDPDRVEIGWRAPVQVGTKPGTPGPPAADLGAIVSLIERTPASRAAAGLPLNVDEVAALRRIAVLLRDRG